MMPALKTRPHKSGIRVRILVLFFGLFLALLLAEGAARLLWTSVKARADVVTDFQLGPKPFPGRGFFPQPGAVFEARYDGDPYDTLPEGNVITYRLNAAGFRDREFPPTGLAGKGIVVLGDSFVFGAGVEAGSRLTEVIQKNMGETVLNLGVTGYSTEDEGDVAAAIVPLLKPRVVLVGYVLNDPVHLRDPEYRGRFGSDLVMRRDGYIQDQREGDSPFYLVRMLREHLATRKRTQETLDWYHDIYRGDGAPWSRSRLHLHRIRDIARENGAEMGVFVMPLFFRLDDDYPFADQHRMVVDYCRAQGIPVLDLLPVFEGRDPEDLVIHPKDLHPNATAHREIGESIASFLKAHLAPR